MWERAEKIRCEVIAQADETTSHKSHKSRRHTEGGDTHEFVVPLSLSGQVVEGGDDPVGDSCHQRGGGDREDPGPDDATRNAPFYC
jgi:hypothetical protein